MQETIAAIASVTIPGGTPIKLGVKVAVASETVRRFLVGDPAIQQIDLLAGATIDRLAAAEHLATWGEVLLADLIGDRSLSRAYFEQNLELRRRLGNRYREGLGLNQLWVIAWRQGNLAIIANARGDYILAGQIQWAR